MSHDGRVIAIADIGSNTLKYSVLRQTGPRHFSVIDSWAETVRLAVGVAATGKIAPDRADRAITSLEAADTRAKSVGATTYVAVATEALRRATNGPAVLMRIQAQTRWRPRVVSGTEEAQLTFAGLRQSLWIEGRSVIVDIGGGSTEVISAFNREVVSIHSIPIGSTVMAERWFDRSPPGRAAIDSARDDALVALAPIVDTSAPERLTELVLSGGNGIYLAQIARRLNLDESLRTGHLIPLLRQLGSLSPESIVGWLTVSVERANVLPAGAAIAAAAIRLVQPTTVRIAPSGIRTGLLLQLLQDEEGETFDGVIIDEDVPLAE